MGLSISHLVVVLVIIVLLFGTGKLRSLGSDLGAAIKGFKKAVGEDKDESQKTLPDDDKKSSN